MKVLKLSIELNYTASDNLADPAVRERLATDALSVAFGHFVRTEELPENGRALVTPQQRTLRWSFTDTDGTWNEYE